MRTNAGPQARRRALDDEFPVEATLLEEAEGQAVEKVLSAPRRSPQSQTIK